MSGEGRLLDGRGPAGPLFVWPILALALEVAYIVVLALPGTPGPNKYGPDPLGQADPEVFA